MRRGFTLLELWGVVAVLALLAAFLFPIFAQAREQGRQIHCLSYVHQITYAYLLYLQDWDEQLPDWFAPLPDAPRKAPYGARRFWPELLEPYLRSESVFFDPSAIWEPQEDARLADYTLMTSGPEGQGTQSDPYWRWPGPPLSLGAVRRPAETIFLLEGWTTTGWRLGPLARHRGGLNVGFLDGHAQRLPVRELGRVDEDRGEKSFWFHYAAADR